MEILELKNKITTIMKNSLVGINTKIKMTENEPMSSKITQQKII
jgi:hypothetical protein